MPKLKTSQPKSKLGTALKKAGAKEPTKKRREPLWKGPCAEGPLGGVTQSMLGRFLVCRERFRVAYIEGLQTDEGFSQRLEYGQMWHVCEEAFALSGNPIVINRVADTPWERALMAYCKGLAEKYPMQREQIAHWYNVCKTQFPIYVEYWKKHPDVLKRTPLLQEQVFDVPYVLPSGRVVRLRGKWDSVDLVKEKRGSGIWLQENKSKGDIDEQAMQRQLTFDLQTMIYLIALEESIQTNPKQTLPSLIGKVPPIKGVRYNVIRRPLSGGKGSIRKHQPTKSNPSGESDEEFYARLGGIIGEDPSYFFMRWHVEITPSDIEKFKVQCLNPVLEQLCDWYQVVADDGKAKRWAGPSALNFRFPYGVYSPLTEGRASDVDEYLNTGSTAGLRRVDSLFSELAE